MNEQAKPDIGTRDLAKIFDEATDLLTAFVVPLYEDDENGRPSHVGTGFFVKNGSANFLVSAAHVLEMLSKKRLYHYVTNKERQELSGSLRLNAWKGDRKNDPIDIGVLKITTMKAPPYPEINKFAIDISCLRPGLIPRSGKVYAIVGFPASKSKLKNEPKTIRAAPYAYRNRSVADRKYGMYGLSPQKNIVLPLDLEECVGSEGQHRNFPNPRGMSGSPLWVLADTEGGVQISYLSWVLGQNIDANNMCLSERTLMRF